MSVSDSFFFLLLSPTAIGALNKETKTKRQCCVDKKIKRKKKGTVMPVHEHVHQQPVFVFLRLLDVCATRHWTGMQFLYRLRSLVLTGQYTKEKKGTGTYYWPVAHERAKRSFLCLLFLLI